MPVLLLKLQLLLLLLLLLAMFCASAGFKCF
jgi:hypothetical protein